MPEAITKYAINSSLGTKDFIPLDKLMRELDAHNKMFVKGDTVLFSHTLHINIKKNPATYDINFVPEIRGKIRLFFHAGTNYRYYYINVYENDALICEQSISDTEYVEEIDVIQGATYIIRLYPSTGSTSGIDTIYLTAKADVKQIGYFAHSITKKEVS